MKVLIIRSSFLFVCLFLLLLFLLEYSLLWAYAKLVSFLLLRIVCKSVIGHPCLCQRYSSMHLTGQCIEWTAALIFSRTYLFAAFTVVSKLFHSHDILVLSMVVPMSDTVRHYKTHKHFGACDFLICAHPKICFIKKNFGGMLMTMPLLTKPECSKTPEYSFRIPKKN